mmetsp:Transcript_28682/g.86098  ORF Transcript_28682/g.86098 Transcript_28682/m.86098 type:complete len:625 (+) Transcript_28682:328-2202(+)
MVVATGHRAWISVLLALPFAHTIPIETASDTAQLSVEASNPDQPQKAIYGSDNRVDEADAPSAWKPIGGATVMLTGRGGLTFNQDGTVGVSVFSSTLLQYIAAIEGGDCNGNLRFGDQVVIGSCSGTLIAPNKIATAGHCIRTEDDCTGTVAIFHATADTIYRGSTLAGDTVYSCVSIDVSQNDNLHDYAVFTLDRDVPVSVATSVAVQAEEVTLGTELYMIGHPTGLPRKYAGGATVNHIVDSGQSSYRFLTDLDSFAGNSGSGVFNVATKKMVGILVSGRADYEDGGCPSQYSQGDAGETCSGVLTIASYASTEPPTPPVPTAVPTSAPTYDPSYHFGVTRGADHCTVSDNGACVGDTEGSYGNNERCTVTVLRQSTLRVIDFSFETGFDFVQICTGNNCNTYTGTEGPQGITVFVGQEIRFSTDHTVVDTGFLLCDNDSTTLDGGFGDGLRPESAAFAVLGGWDFCSTSESSTCIFDTAGSYGNSEECILGVLRDVSGLVVNEFALEAGYDFLHLCPVGHIGTDISRCQNFTGSGEGLANVHLQQGQIIRFKTDSSIVAAGFNVCAADANDTGEDREAPPTGSPTQMPTTAAPTLSPTASPTPSSQCAGACRRGNRPRLAT